jgi:SfnB family sulfur acquisition oxidoreductase
MTATTAVDHGPGHLGPGAATPAAHVIASDEEALRVAERSRHELAREAGERDRQRRLPWAELAALSASGLLGITTPRRFGGADVSAVTLGEVVRLLSAGDSNVGQIPQSHFTFLHALRELGTEDQQRFFFTEVLAGRRFGNAQAERGSSEGKPFATRLVPRGDGTFVVSGRKSYCTGALFADWIPVVARGEDDKNYIAFVPSEAPGVSVVDDWNGMGQRVTASGTVDLDEVVVPAGNVIAHHLLFTRPTTLGAVAQLVHAAIDAGLAQGALDEAVRLVKDRGAWWESGVERAAEEPLLVQRFGELAITVAGSRALLADAGRALDVALAQPTDATTAEASIAVAMAKAFADRASVELGSALLEVVGTRGTLEPDNLNRFWRKARTHTLHDPVRWKVQHIGRYVLSGTPPPRHGAI